MSTYSGSQSSTAPRLAHVPPPVILASRFVRKLRGRSQPILFEDADCGLYVLKLSAALQNSRQLASELIGNGLCHALGFLTPPSFLVQVDNQFLDRYPGMWHQTQNGSVRPSPGIHYGTAFVGHVEGTGRPFQLPPKMSGSSLDNQDEVCGMYLFDIWANHLDRRQRVYLIDFERESYRAIFLDNGLLFGGPLWSFANSTAQFAFRRKDAANFKWKTDIVQAWLHRFRTIIPLTLPKILASVPSEWCGSELITLESVLLQRLTQIEELIQPFIPTDC